MRTRWIVLVAAAAGFPARPVLATDAPHDASVLANQSCDDCHRLHGATGSGLTNQPTNFDLCRSCHNDPARTPAPGRLGMPWYTEDQAAPGAAGHHHSWSGGTGNPAYGADPPQDASMLSRTGGGRLQCSTCHDQHAAGPGFAPGSRHTSVAPGAPQNPSGGPAGATLTLVSAGGGALARGYRVYLPRAGEFVISHDAKLASPSWFNWNGTGWAAGTQAGPGRPFAAGTDVAADDPAVTIRFSTAGTAGQYWDFYVSYPFLRTANAVDQMCEDCHRSRVQSHTRVEGGDVAFPANGVNVFSHPVGVALDANGRGYDRAGGALLDANGALQGTGDGNPSNDLKLASDSTVRCMTCHYPHGADSNSLSADPR